MINEILIKVNSIENGNFHKPYALDVCEATGVLSLVTRDYRWTKDNGERKRFETVRVVYNGTDCKDLLVAFLEDLEGRIG